MKLWNTPTTDDNLQRNKKLMDEIKELRERLNEKGIEHHIEKKQLLRAITVANRKTKNALRQRDAERDRIRDLKGNYGERH
jgi:cell division septum initiation protein DivIVA